MPSGIVIGLMLIWMIARGAWHNVIVLVALLVYVATAGADNQTFSLFVVAAVSVVMIVMQSFGPLARNPDDDDMEGGQESSEQRDDR